MRKILLPALVLALAGGCSSDPALKDPGAIAADASLSDLREKLDSARDKALDEELGAEGWREADRELAQIIADPRFAQLETEERAITWDARGSLAVNLDDKRKIRAYGLQALKLQPVWPWLWIRVARAQEDLGEFEASALSFSHFLRQLPEEAVDSNLGILEVIDHTGIGSPSTRRLLEAIPPKLWNAPSTDAGEVWRRLALERQFAGDRKGASAALRLIRTPDTIIRVRIDRRFDGLYDPRSPDFDVAKVRAARIVELERMFANDPRRLWYLLNLNDELFADGRDEDVLRLCDEALAKAANPPGTEASFDDMYLVDQLLRDRASALERLGRTQESMQAFEQYARTLEDGKLDAYAVLRLANEQCDLRNGTQTLASVNSIAEIVDRDDTWFHRMRLRAARLTGDAATTTMELAWLRDHRDEDWASYVKGLLGANRVDEAASGFIAVLASEQRRDEALVWLQEYKTPKANGIDRQFAANWQKLKSRSDVIAAAERVGRIEKYDAFSY